METLDFPETTIDLEVGEGLFTLQEHSKQNMKNKTPVFLDELSINILFSVRIKYFQSIKCTFKIFNITFIEQ